MEAAESLLISTSGHFHSGFDFELPISFESGKRKKNWAHIFKKKMEWVCPLHSFRCLIIKEY